MLLRRLTDGGQTGTGSVTVKSQILGAVLISTDGTNNGTVILRRDDGSGTQLLDIATSVSLWITGPIGMEGTETLHWTVTGTGCAVQLYEWVT